MTEEQPSLYENFSPEAKAALDKINADVTAKFAGLYEESDRLRKAWRSAADALVWWANNPGILTDKEQLKVRDLEHRRYLRFLRHKGRHNL